MSTQLRTRIALKTAAQLLARQAPAITEREQTLLAIIEDLSEPLPLRATSTDSLRDQVRAAAMADARFNSVPESNDTTVTIRPDVWICDLLTPENGEGWKAIVQAANGKTYEVAFTIDGGKIILGAEYEVVRTATYQKVKAKAAPVMELEVPVLRARAVTSDVHELSAAIMFMPAGDHTITPGAGEGSAEVTIRIDASTATILNASLKKINAAIAPQRVFIDKEHEGKEATAWPEEFFWSQTPEPGVYARVEYSELGKQLILGKVIRAFSPSFTTDAALPKKILPRQHIVLAAGKRGSAENPARVTGLAWPDVGTLTNNPAFRKILPLWAKSAAGARPTSN